MINKEKRQFAKSLYIAGTLTRKEICRQCGNIAESTLRKWVESGKWDDLKEIQSITRSNLLQDAYAQLAAVNKKIREELNNVPTKELSDAKGVLRKEIETLSSNPLHIYVEVFEEFFNYLARTQPRNLASISELAYKFIEELNNKK